MSRLVHVPVDEEVSLSVAVNKVDESAAQLMAVARVG